MRTFIFPWMAAVLLLLPLFCFSQVLVDDTTITIDLDVPADSVNIPVLKGKYKLMTASETAVIENFFVDKKLIEYPPLSDSGTKAFDSLAVVKNRSEISLVFHDNTEYVVSVKLKGETKPRTYILRSKSDWTWKTSFGANAIALVNRNKFINANGTVADNRDRKQFELMPSIMFTFMNFQDNVAYGFTAGLGTDFNKISIFTGLSLGIGQNVILTGGVALHEQIRPDSDFSPGQSIDPSLGDDKLNKEYYRLNPFVGITLNLNNNPFKKKDSE